MKTFSEKVVACALKIPKGKVSTYGRIARAAGAGPMASQSVSGILWRAEQKGTKGIPWHRIVYADGRVWLNEKHKKERMKRYKKENIKVDERGRIINFHDVLFEFK